MSNVLKSDLYRLGKSKLFYFITALTGVTAFLLVMLINNDIRLGIYVFNDLIAFKRIEDIIRIGIQYNKSIGIWVAVFICVFIGQEYQWKTWQHKWIVSKSRTNIYASKAMLSSVVSVIIFLLFETITLLFSGQMYLLFTNEYVATIICGSLLYAALGSVICMFSMLIRNTTAAAMFCIGYVLFSETLIYVVKNISSFSNTIENIVEWVIQHTIYGMSYTISSTLFPIDSILPILINSVAIIFLSNTIGLLAFRKYEL